MRNEQLTTGIIKRNSGHARVSDPVSGATNINMALVTEARIKRATHRIETGQTTHRLLNRRAIKTKIQDNREITARIQPTKSVHRQAIHLRVNPTQREQPIQATRRQLKQRKTITDTNIPIRPVIDRAKRTTDIEPSPCLLYTSDAADE